jgi:peptidoglycan-associated lipoprotein
LKLLKKIGCATVEYNLALGERRANNTKKYLVSLGIASNRISTISYGRP